MSIRDRINNWIDDRLKARDRSFFEAQIRRGATDALHYYTCVRPISEWRRILDEAEKDDANKYMSMADLIIRSGYDQQTRKN